MTGLLLVNPRAGGDSPDAAELARESERRGIRCRILGDGDDPGEIAREAVAADALGIAGGDGSLAAVADAALERGVPFVCVPFGTHNHFARDLGLARDDPIGALDAFAGTERRVDVARVNGRLFLNNLSLGAYASLVHRRERHRRRDEALARARALLRVARERHHLHVRVDGEPMRPRVLLVANNAYALDLFTLGERETLDGGRLHLYAAEGWLPHRWIERQGTELLVELDNGRVRAAADGEPLELEAPLRFELLAQALRVLVPPRAPQ